tara:strand:- start:1041 stop:1298 length:258 start_codon:yes stop_codon:yes gene_type:complete
MVLITKNEIKIFAPTEKEANEVRSVILEANANIYIKPAVDITSKRLSEVDKESWVCRGWISNDSGEKGGFEPEAIHAILSQHLSS